jgi:ABC-type uncharacterized transport system involved in gliding motility auxiliary subunit
MKPGHKAFAVALLLAGLLLVNFLAARLPLRLDATAGKIYTLTAGTKAILAGLGEPVTLDFYFTRDAEGMPVQFVNYGDQIREMLRQYARAAGGKITLNVINPRPDTPEEEAASRAGLTPVNNPESGAPPVYFGLVATQADQRQAIASFNLQREQLLEYDLSLLVHSVQHHQDAKKKLGLITSLPLQGASPQDMQLMMMLQQRAQPGQYVTTEWGRTYAIQAVAPDAEELPAGLDALAVIHPQNLSRKLQFAIDQFLLSGKPVLLALDPSSQHFKRQGGQQQQLMMMMGGGPANVSSDLPILLRAYGVGYRSDAVVGDLNRATKVGGANGSVITLPAWLSLDADDVNRESAAIAHLKSFLFVEAGGLDLNPLPGVSATPLLQTTDQAGEMPAALLQMSSGEDAASKLTAPGKRTLAALLRGKFTTAFPDGAPKADPPADPAVAGVADPGKPDAPPSAPALKESSATSTLLVVADTDWLFDQYIFDSRYLPAGLLSPINDNLDLAANLVDFLAGSPELLSIRGKGPTQRPFKVVQEMEASARKQFDAQLAGLEARLSEVQQKISGMTAKRAEGGRLVLSPEMEAEIEKFRQDEAAIRRQQREIKRTLREDIDALGRRLLWANLLATPLLVGAFGFWFRQRRRQA